MALINQPFDGQFGDLLIEQMHEAYNQLTIVVAFARNSGVLRLKPELERFKANGNTVRVFVGVDFLGTSHEALRNLLALSDSLYVIHSEDNSVTFHSKIYYLENKEKIWMAVGSNNLTASGLWTNLESCQCQEYTVGTPEYVTHFDPFSELIALYTSDSCEYSMKINSEDDIYELMRSGYLTTEVRQHIARNAESLRGTGTSEEALFGRPRRAGLPRINAEDKSGKTISIRRGETVCAIHAIEESNDNERIWFEARKLTGGSRNILDLSKLGSVISGTGAGSRYETDNPQYILGGVAFFDIEPENTTIMKDIIINYSGIDYTPCTVKFTSNNGSWRIQLKGQSDEGKKLQSINGVGWLVNKILVFEKIRTDYYTLFVLDPGNLPACKSASYVIARNGSGNDSKEFGLFIF